MRAPGDRNADWKTVFVVPCGAVGAGRWPFPRFLRCRSTPICRRAARSPERAATSMISSPLRSLCIALADPATVANHRASRPPLLGFVGTPLHRSASGTGPRSCCHARAPGCRSRDRCRPRGFAPPRRFTVPGSRRRIAACCRSWGSSCFGRSPLSSPDGSGKRGRDDFPATLVRTPRRIPSPAAAPRHRGRCTSCSSTGLQPPTLPLAQPGRESGRPRRSDGL